MSVRTKLEWAGLAAVLSLVLAFVVSFASGLLRERQPVAAETSIEEVRTPEPPSGARIRVEVLNASGTPGLARLATSRLRERGFDVVFFGNARGFPPDSTRVLDRAGNLSAAEEVASALGVTRVESSPDPRLLLDVTVVLGKDWEAGRSE